MAEKKVKKIIKKLVCLFFFYRFAPEFDNKNKTNYEKVICYTNGAMGCMVV